MLLRLTTIIHHARKVDLEHTSQDLTMTATVHVHRQPMRNAIVAKLLGSHINIIIPSVVLLRLAINIVGMEFHHALIAIPFAQAYFTQSTQSNS